MHTLFLSKGLYTYVTLYFIGRTRGAAPKIKISAACSQHPLFPVLDYNSRASYAHGQRLTVIESQIGRIEKDVSEVKSVLDELKSLMKDQIKSRYDLKNGGIDVIIILA